MKIVLHEQISKHILNHMESHNTSFRIRIFLFYGDGKFIVGHGEKYK